MENKFFFVQKREISGLGSDGWNFFKGGSSARKRLRWRIVYFVVQKRLRWRVVCFVVRKRLRWRVVYFVVWKRLRWRTVCFVVWKRLRWRTVCFVVWKRLRWRAVYFVAQKRLRWRAVCFVARRDYLKWVAGVALCAIPTLDTHRNDAHSLCGTPALPPRKTFSFS